MTTRSLVPFFAAAALVVLILAYEGYEERRRVDFRRVCWSLHLGESADNFERALREVGGVEYLSSDPSKRVWHIDSVLGWRIAICTVAVDDSGAVLGSQAKGNRPK